MAAVQKMRRTWLLWVGVVSVATLIGCSDGGDSGPVAPSLGEEVDLTSFFPSSLEGYDVVYRTTQGGETAEARTRTIGVETVYDGVYQKEPVPVECFVLEQEPDMILQRQPIRTYTDGQYNYAVKIWGVNGLSTWDPLRYYRPKMQQLPDENPRLNGTFDSGVSTLVISDQYSREVITSQTWTTYMGIEDDVAVPAGSFDGVLKMRIKQWQHYKQTSPADTTQVIIENTSETYIYMWCAENVGLIKLTGGAAVGQVPWEKVLVSGTIDGVTYPE